MALTFLSVKGEEVAKHIEALGELRIQVFAEWPYLYKGDLDYERNYLKVYQRTPYSFVFLVFDGPQLVGATTAILLTEESPEFQKPFLQKGFDPSTVVYFGESLLLPEYRGQGLGKVFMEKRLAYAQSLPQVQIVAFCAVVRDHSHPSRPANYRPLDDFWKSQGFVPHPDMLAQFSWKDWGESKETPKLLKFWLKSLK